KGAYSEYGTKGLLREEFGIGRDLVEQRRRDTRLLADPAIDEARTSLDRQLDALFHLRRCQDVDHRAHVGGFVGRVTQPGPGDLVGELGHELVVHVAVHVDALGGGAALARDLQ